MGDTIDVATRSRSAATLRPGTLVGEYRVERLLGEGGSAEVYAATHLVIGKQAAIKVIGSHLSGSAVAVERFMEEARAVNRIRHPNIVDIFSCGRLPDGRVYLVMEWLRGHTLYTRLRQKQPALDEALDILLAVCDALGAAHAAGVIHRDVKPDNVFLIEGGGVKLLDFGIAKLTCKVDGEARRTRTGILVGTPEYIAPEQARGLPVDARTDIYSLGVVAYEVLVGRRPFIAEFPIDVINEHLNTAPPSPRAFNPSLPLAAETLLLWMLEKAIAHRPSLSQVRGCFVELLELALMPEIVIEPTAAPPKARPRRMPVRWLALPLLGAMVVGWATARARSSSKSTPPGVVMASAMPVLRAPADGQMCLYYEKSAPAPARAAKPVRSRPHRQRHNPDYLVDPFAARVK